jgi:hypothetical protein
VLFRSMTNRLLHNKPRGKYCSLCMYVYRKQRPWIFYRLFVHRGVQTCSHTTLHDLYLCKAVNYNKQICVAALLHLLLESNRSWCVWMGAFNIHEIKTGGTSCLLLQSIICGLGNPGTVMGRRPVNGAM